MIGKLTSGPPGVRMPATKPAKIARWVEPRPSQCWINSGEIMTWIMPVRTSAATRRGSTSSSSWPPARSPTAGRPGSRKYAAIVTAIARP